MNPFFTILGVNERTTPEELKLAWRKKCLEHHPDQGGDPEVFKQIMHAYKMLTDLGYQNEFKKQDLSEILLFKLRIAVGFEKAFFGHSVFLNYNRVELHEKTLEILPVKEVESVCIRVDIPAGSTGGFERIFPGLGLKCGNQLGQCHVQVLPARHPKYRVEAKDVFSEEGVPLEMMLRGGKIEVLTMWGLKTVRIPPGSQPGDRLVIKNAGVLKEGNHLVSITPIFPSGDDLRQKRSLKDLQIDWSEREDQQTKIDESLDNLFNQMRK